MEKYIYVFSGHPSLPPLFAFLLILKQVKWNVCKRNHLSKNLFISADSSFTDGFGQQ
jgi:hypothetical protein